MTALALAEKKDREVGPSSCCPGAVDRWSDPCNAAYCEACDRWATPPAVIPVHHGPTWERDPDTGRFIAPKLSLGPVIDAWVKRYIKSPDGTGMWEFTREQRRMLYWIYAIDEHGRWLYRELNIQRLKGWGKDPFAALLSLIEMVGPCRPVVKDGKVVLDDAGNPVARRQSSAWVQVFAVAKDQTKNTMKMFAVLASPQLKRDYAVVIGKEQVVGLHGEVTIEAVTSSPETREGNRPTFQIGNEPHHWKENNAGHEMREVMDRNNKLPLSRILWITNAYNPSQMSVGQSNRESWEMSLGEDAKYVDSGVMYDSLEAPENARMVKRELAPVLEAVRGDSHWVDIEGIISRILDSRNPTSTSRRFYFNQVGADEEAWVDPQDVDATVHPQVKAWRTDPDIETDSLRLGWAPVRPQDEVVVFFDGGKSDDHTAISGCRLSDGYTFGIGFWGRPKTHDARLPWFAPRADVDERMVEAHERFNVIALWADPSHAKDDEDDTPYWDGLLDEWHRRWKDELKFWAVKTGDGVHSVKWDMTSPVRQGHFVEAAQEFVRDMQEHSFQHCGHPMWIRYMKNAKRVMSAHGVTLWKGSRGSKRKIDGAVTHVGARMMRKMILNRAEEQKPRGGRFWY